MGRQWPECVLREDSGKSSATHYWASAVRWQQVSADFVNAGTVWPCPMPVDADAIEHCKARMASYKKPKLVEFVSAIPRSADGMVDRAKADELYGGGYPVTA